MSPKLKSQWSQMEKDIDLKDLTNADSIRQLIAQQNKQKAWDRLFKNLKKVHAKNRQFTPEEVDADVDEAIKAIRQQQA